MKRRHASTCDDAGTMTASKRKLTRRTKCTQTLQHDLHFWPKLPNELKLLVL